MGLQDDQILPIGSLLGEIEASRVAILCHFTANISFRPSENNVSAEHPEKVPSRRPDEFKKMGIRLFHSNGRSFPGTCNTHDSSFLLNRG
ncbi:hypothetical protein AVEN_246556-1 [Araneus ventricosus]|uniref:Uncharacterized protein n=1 Tax=Araneus ventricosus TaxID=182803 RepID=A0A4Y2DFQ9_ARAVE|nr:hypothetical protein AVEN_246556-1 [Araneus ventricosus]